MSLTLFGTSRSRAFRVLWMLEEIGLPYTHRPLTPDRCAQDGDYLAINPSGTIPCLVDDGFVLSESLAINLWLARKAGALKPEGERGDALALQWSLWAATALEPAYVRWATQSHWLPEDRRDPAQAAAALDELQRPLRRLDDALAARPGLLGDAFTVADLNVAGVIPLLRHIDAGAFAHVARWLARCCARDAYARAGARP
jgi:glutathione S-transferase